MLARLLRRDRSPSSVCTSFRFASSTSGCSPPVFAIAVSSAIPASVLPASMLRDREVVARHDPLGARGVAGEVLAGRAASARVVPPRLEVGAAERQSVACSRSSDFGLSRDEPLEVRDRLHGLSEQQQPAPERVPARAELGRPGLPRGHEADEGALELLDLGLALLLGRLLGRRGQSSTPSSSFWICWSTLLGQRPRRGRNARHARDADAGLTMATIRRSVNERNRLRPAGVSPASARSSSGEDQQRPERHVRELLVLPAPGLLQREVVVLRRRDAFSISRPGTEHAVLLLQAHDPFEERAGPSRSRAASGAREQLEVVEEVPELLLAELLLAEVEDPRKPEPQQPLALDLEEELGQRPTARTDGAPRATLIVPAARGLADVRAGTPAGRARTCRPGTASRPETAVARVLGDLDLAVVDRRVRRILVLRVELVQEPLAERDELRIARARRARAAPPRCRLSVPRSARSDSACGPGRR